MAVLNFTCAAGVIACTAEAVITLLYGVFCGACERACIYIYIYRERERERERECRKLNC